MATLMYTYLDEVKRNYLDTNLRDIIKGQFNFYSMSSVTFESEYYKETFEDKWKCFRETFHVPEEKCLHFAECKKLINSNYRKLIEFKFEYEKGEEDYASLIQKYDLPNNEFVGTRPLNTEDELKKIIASKVKDSDVAAYNYFNTAGVFSENDLFRFFLVLRELLLDSNFFIVHTDIIDRLQKYLPKDSNPKRSLTKETTLYAPNLRKKNPEIVFSAHLNSLISTLILTEKDGYYYLDENKPDEVYTKLRFDGDGKEFDARSDLKRAFNNIQVVGTRDFNSKTTNKILDEIRFIKKDEVGHKYLPSHAGMEVVDFLCSLIACSTRLEYLKGIGVIDDKSCEEKFNREAYINIQFEDGRSVSFSDIIDNNLTISRIIAMD